jgi:DNA-binding TFAR19-related protein (PDSD5 family)
MINTTTIPTQLNNTSYICIFGILTTGFLIGASMMELFLFKIREKQREAADDSSEEEEEPRNSYCDKYTDEFEALSTRVLTEEELQNLNTKIVREQVAEKVEVLLTFDKETDTFWYYTDQLKEVSYDILETVARKFAIDYDCKMICLEPVQEGQSASEAAASEAVASEAVASASEAAAVAANAAAPSVFAKFKKYNTGGKGAASNFTAAVKVVEQRNHFRYRGKIVDYEESLKKEEKKEEPTLDYASYKKLLEKKEK